jgi:hypothetical protein
MKKTLIVIMLFLAALSFYTGCEWDTGKGVDMGVDITALNVSGEYTSTLGVTNPIGVVVKAGEYVTNAVNITAIFVEQEEGILLMIDNLGNDYSGRLYPHSESDSGITATGSAGQESRALTHVYPFFVTGVYEGLSTTIEGTIQAELTYFYFVDYSTSIASVYVDGAQTDQAGRINGLSYAEVFNERSLTMIAVMRISDGTVVEITASGPSDKKHVNITDEVS